MSTNTDKQTRFNFDFVGKAPLFGAISLILTVASLIYLAMGGIHYGIDFAGGTEVQVKFEKELPIAELRNKVEDLHLLNPSIQTLQADSGSEYVIRFQIPEGKDEKEINERQNAAVASLRTALEGDFKAYEPDIRRVDSVGPQVGAELKRNGLLAVFYSLLVILIYISLRFDYKYAPGAVITLAHDAIITLALYMLMGKEMNISVLAALLTLIGYSLNDTIVVFDRIREVSATSKGAESKAIVNRSINEMLGRTMITAVTTIVATGFLWWFADGDVADIAFILCAGTVFGTYSSVYVAAPIMMLMEKVNLAPRPTSSNQARA
ncbi:MAG: protein translocase subunit SecF [Bdellovibrionaceae bacterium]|nr:protein translocase subunit SecF [Pseudobdellovibrionaceae bacterium]